MSEQPNYPLNSWEGKMAPGDPGCCPTTFAHRTFMPNAVGSMVSGSGPLQPFPFDLNNAELGTVQLGQVNVFYFRPKAIYVEESLLRSTPFGTRETQYKIGDAGDPTHYSAADCANRFYNAIKKDPEKTSRISQVYTTATTGTPWSINLVYERGQTGLHQSRIAENNPSIPNTRSSLPTGVSQQPVTRWPTQAFQYPVSLPSTAAGPSRRTLNQPQLPGPLGMAQPDRTTSQAPSRKLPQYTAQPSRTQLPRPEPTHAQSAGRQMRILQPSLVPGLQYTGSAATLLPLPDPTDYGRPELAPSILECDYWRYGPTEQLHVLVGPHVVGELHVDGAPFITSVPTPRVYADAMRSYDKNLCWETVQPESQRLANGFCTHRYKKEGDYHHMTTVLTNGSVVNFRGRIVPQTRELTAKQCR